VNTKEYLAQSVAHDVIEQVLTEDWFTPEGLELFKWLWVPATYEKLMVVPHVVSQRMLQRPEEDDYYAEPQMVEIRTIMTRRGDMTYYGPYLARVGWNVEERIAVLFFLEGGKL